MASDNVGELKIALSFDNKAFDTSINEAETKASSFGAKLGNVGSAIAKTFAAATAAGAVAAGKIVADATKAFANYEQLVGGVETLFKDAAGTVQEYANVAFETAGMSANDYMENVTSFSASLLQSLGGDAAAAAEIANQTIIDMSDNANKMGTDIERITDAYQGFAKQNYTMLDNLKLGYGGTKTEMERLLADATALSGIEYDINSLNDVFEAIHVIQNELEITGTTALEASTTISGSLNALKAAWQNTLTGIAGGTDDFDGLITNLVSTVGTFAENVLPTITTALSGVSKLIEKLAPVLVKEMPKLVSSVLPSLLNAASQLVLGLVEALPELITTIINSIIEILPSILEQLINIIPTLLQSIVDAILQITLMLTEPENLQMVLDAAVQLLMAIVNALPQILTALTQALPQILQNIVSFLLDPANLMQIIAAAVELFMGIIKAMPQLVEMLMSSLGGVLSSIIGAIDGWIGPLIGAALKAAGEFIGAMLGALNGLINSVAEVGLNIVKGIWDGISGAAGWLWNQVTNFCSGILDAIKDFFGIHSPSRVFEDEVGAMLAEGIGVGFTVEMEDVSADMTAAIPVPASDSMDSWSGAIDNIYIEDGDEVIENRALTVYQNIEVNNDWDIEQIGDALQQEARRVA